MFESKLTNEDAQFLTAGNKIDVMLENARFEEIDGNPLRARKIYEQLENEICPGYIKSALARINFEKRDGKFEKAKELYYHHFLCSLNKNDELAVTVIATQYSRFLSTKCHDHNRALDIMDQAISNKSVANKVLYLSFISLAQSQTESAARVPLIYKKALAHLEGINDKTSVKYRDL